METLPGPSKRIAILYQNPDCDLTLIDIPTSISNAQGGGRQDVLLSTVPLEEPFSIAHDPKSEKAKHKQSQSASNPLHVEYKATIENALAQLRGHVSGKWCLPRKLMTQVPKTRDKDVDMEIDDPEKELNARLREWSASKEEEEPFDFDKMMASIGTTSGPNVTSSDAVTSRWLVSYKPSSDASASSNIGLAVGHHSGHIGPAPNPIDHFGILPISQSPEPGHDANALEPSPWSSSFYNSYDYPLDLTVFETHSQPGSTTYQFKVPSKSCFFLSDSTHSDAFRANFKELTEDYILPRHFDFILLDPPWPSGSVRRKGNYDQIGGMPYMMKHLVKMDIDNYIEHNGLVAIWITNKASLREYVLGPGGLFEAWNVGYMEEWIWIKTTNRGEPMFSIDSEWRKPYEVLLLGRAAPNSWTTMATAPEIKRRVIAAVPDVHSRKPCLKELIEPFLPDNYSALEIFSRYLVEGWTSWGNECVKYNWDKYWVPADSDGSGSG